MKICSKNWILKWLKSSFLQPQKKIKISEIVGFAVLKKDEIMGKKYWVSYRGEKASRVDFTEEQPLVFPPQGLPIGTRVYLLEPKKERK